MRGCVNCCHCTPLTLGSRQLDMSLTRGAEGGLGFSMAPLGSALALIPKFSVSNNPLAEWEERLEGAAHLYRVPAWLVADLAINSLEGDARHAVMAMPEEEQAILPQFMSHLESLFGEKGLFARTVATVLPK